MPIRRRTLLSGVAMTGVAGALGALTSGCEPDVSTPGGSPGSATPSAQDDPDQALLDEVRADLESRLAAAIATGAQFPRTAPAIGQLTQMHQDHRAVLDPDAATSDPETTPLTTRHARAAVRRVLAGERVHHDLLADAAGTAVSGPLARLLASMAASVSVHLVTTQAALAGIGIDVPALTATPDPPVPSAAGLTDLDTTALQTTLAAEHAAVYVYGVLGARTSQTAEAELFAEVRDAYLVHRDRRDQLIGVLAAAGVEPVAPEVAYAVPGTADLSTTAGVRTAAADLEEGCATTYAVQVAGTTAATRVAAIGWLDRTAVRELAFRGTPGMFPGEGELADR